MSWWTDFIDFLNPLSDPVKEAPEEKTPEPEPPKEVPEAPKAPKKRGGTHKTTLGRVVYNRKRHFFTLKDVKRILRNILTEENGITADPLQFANDLVEILNALREISGSYTTFGIYDQVKGALDSFLALFNQPKK